MVSWINPNGGNWDVGANWSTGTTPGAGDVAVIDTTAAATVTVRSGDGIQVQAVTTGGNDTLAITGGSLTVTAGNSTLSGSLSMTGGTLIASGSTVELTANGSTTASGILVDAQAGATLSLPQLTSFVANLGGGFHADGTGSVLDVSALTTVTQGDPRGWCYTQATNGGTLKLTGLASLGCGSDYLYDTGKSTLLDGNLTTLNGVGATLDGTDKQVANSWKTFTNGGLAVTGGSYTLPGLTDADGSGLSVGNRGSLALPGLTRYAVKNASFTADGAGVLDVSALSTVTGQGVWDIEADGGTVKLTGLTGPTVPAGITVGNGGEVALGNALVTMPTSGSSATINVPQIPPGTTIGLATNGRFTGGTTFNIASGDRVYLGGFVNGFGTGGTFTGGVVFNVGAGATVDLTSEETVTYGGTLTGSGAGTVQLGGGTLAIGLGGLTMDFAGSMFQWTGGVINSSVGDLTNLGTINLVGDNPKGFYNDGTLDDFGTILQTGAGNLALHSDNVTATTLKIEAGASYLIESDAGIDNYFGDATAIVNAGKIAKTAGTGTSTLLVKGPITNTGTIEADSDTLFLDSTSLSQVSGTTLTGGAWKALNGATLTFPPGTAVTNNAGNISLGGAGATIAALAGLTANGGSFTLADKADFKTAGDFTDSGTLTVAAGGTLTVAGNYVQIAPGTLDVQIGGTPASGQFGQVAVQDAVTLAGNFNASLVNGFGPSGGQNYPVLTFASATGTFASFAGLSPFFTESLNPTSLTLVDGTINAVDLGLAQVSAPTTATAGQSIAVTWQVSNPGGQAANGNWQDSVYLSTAPAVTSGSTLLGSVTHSGGLAAGGSYNASLTAAAPALPPGNYYVLVQADNLYQVPDPDRANNTLAAGTGQLAVAVPALTLGTPINGTFTAADEDQYYQVTVPAGGALNVALTSAASTGALALYVSQGTEPTPYNYQEVADVANQPNQTVSVPQVLTAGSYYILVHSVSGDAARAGFTLTAGQVSALSVTVPTSPYTGGNGGNVTLEIDGANFTSSTTARLSLSGTTIPATAIDFVNPSLVYATFNLAGASAGNYTLTVQAGAQSTTAPTLVNVAPSNPGAGAGGLEVQLSTPQYVRSGRTATVVVTYTNTSGNDMVAPLLAISSTNPNVLFATPDDLNNYTQDAQILAVAPSGPAGILRAGQSGQLTLTLLSNDTLDGDQIPVQVDQIQAGQSIDWASQKTALQPPAVPTAAWNIIWTNLIATLGTTTDSYNAALAQAATYLGNLGETTAQVSNVGRLSSFLVSQANASFPTTALTSAVDAILSTPGKLSLAIDRTFLSSISGRDQKGIFGLGWATSWQSSLSFDSSGNVSIDNVGAVAFFARQADGTYLDTAGEYGTLTTSKGVYTFTDTAGTRFVFLPRGQLNYIQDTNGNRITLGYDAQNQLVTLSYSNLADTSVPAEQLTLTYTQGLVTHVADGTGDTWTYQHDTAGHLLSVTGPGNLTTSYTYDTSSTAETANALLSITNPDGSQQNFSYAPQTGRLNGTSENGGADPITYAYLGEGEVTATDTANNQSTIWYNDLGLASRVEDPRGGVDQFLYDANGNLVTSTDAIGDTYQYSYDGKGDLTQMDNPLGQTVQMTYGALSNLTSITDAVGNKTQSSYDATGNLLNITYPDGSQQSFNYDPRGNLTETIEQNGHPVSYQYNAQGLLTQQKFIDGSSQSFTYDAHGNLQAARTFNAAGTLTGTTTLTYTATNELTSITYPNGQYLKFTYNPATGQRTQSVDQDGFTVNYSYDSLGRLSELTDGSGNLIVQYKYDNLGRLQQKLNGNGTSTTYGYDAAGNLTSEVNYAGGTTVNSSFTYTYNLLGEIVSATDAAGNVTRYSYDLTDQLTQVTLPGGESITYVYNAAGDRTEVIGGGTTSYGSNADDQITQVGSAMYTYDANGNLHTVTDSPGTTTYTFNDLNQLVSIASPDGSTRAFQYSPLGFMVGSSTTSGGSTSQTNYLVDPTGLGYVVASYNGSSSLIAHYVHGLGLVSQIGPSGTGYYDFDASGNSVGITGASGSYVNRYSYLPFGETTTVSATLPNAFTFEGHYGVMQLGDNLFYMRARDYTPETGQFLSNDRWGLSGGDTNLRRLAGNDSIDQVDPVGLGHWIATPIGEDGVFAPDVGLFHPQYVFDDGTNTGYGSNTENGQFSIPPDELQRYEDTGHTRLLSPELDDDAIRRAMDQVNSTGHWRGRDYNLLNPFRPHHHSQDWWREVMRNYHPPSNPGPGAGSINRVPHDPNALLGPGGYGTQNFIQPTGSLPYTIDFENDGSAAAQDVTITQQLDGSLDWSTFQLGSVGFGPVNVTAPAGLTKYQTTVAYQNTDGTPLNVQVSLDFNVQTGLLTATFTSLDPATGQAPAGVFDGFLPPDNSGHVGEGYIQYTVKPKTGLTTGTTINQQASVVFDINAPINTNTVSNTIDAGAPSSSVAPLPGITTTPGFTVSWSGQDDRGGSAIAAYDLYVSVDGGAFTPWLTDTPQTSATYAGAFGHTYAFYSVATDNVGNRQATPNAAQASTTLEPPPQLPPPPIPLTGDVTDVVSLTFTPGSKKRKAGGLTETLTVRNRSGQDVEGPFTLVLHGLKRTVKLRGAMGSVGTGKGRSPFLVVAVPGGRLQPDGSVSTALRFSAKPNPFTVSVFAATAPH
jgi:RHS repeat-associated protein